LGHKRTYAVQNGMFAVGQKRTFVSAKIDAQSEPWLAARTGKSAGFSPLKSGRCKCLLALIF
jgi:hypothetical protein